MGTTGMRHEFSVEIK